MSPTVEPGTTFAGYRIESQIGRGGMGVVYLATDLSLERPVALKLIAPEYAQDERFRRRFLKEPRLAAALDHPNVVPIYEAREHDGQLYLAMRYVPGSNVKTLREREGVLEPGRALAILAQVADALDAAHRRGLVHRDVKPANVLLDEEGHAYLTDFGITKQVGTDSTQTGEIVGTLDYLAPEQIRSEPVDGRTDEYALGCVLYECVAGRPPFRRDTQMEAIWAHLQEPPPPLASHPRLDPVVAKALAKERDDRYATCAELIGAARAALSPAAPTAPVTVAVRRLATRRRAILAAGGAVLAASVAAAVLALSSGGEAEAVPVESGVAAIDGKGDVAAFVDTTTVPSNVAVGEGGVWFLTTQDRTVSRIDPRTRKVVSTFEMQGIPSDIAVGAGSVWVGTVGGNTDVNTTGSISQVDPSTGKVVRTVRLPGKGNSWASVGYPGIAIGEGAVWAANPKGSISRIDPRSGRVTGEVKLEAGGLAAGKEGVWVVNENSVTRINARTNRPGQMIQSGSNQLEGIAVGAGSVWATAGAAEGLVWRFEPGPEPTARSIDVGSGAGFIAFGAGAVWVANYSDGTVSRIDPRTNRVTSRISIGPVQALAVGEGVAWVTLAGAARDGTLPASACSPIEAGGGTPDVLVASDLPLQGPLSAYPRRLLEAIQEVFRKHAYRAGRFRVGLQSCDASTAQSGVWEPRRCAANANAYGRANGLVAVIGPFNSQCTQYELPSLNRAPGGPLPIVSPANTHPGFTREATPPPDGYRGEPEVYYPTGRRNYFRVVGRETLQGIALAMTADRLGLDRVYVLQYEPDDNGWARTYVVDPFLRAAQRLRVGVVRREGYKGAARSFDALAARIDRSGAAGVVIGGDFYDGGDRLLKALRSRLGRRLPILTGFLFVFPQDILRSAGRAAEGVYLTTTDIPGRARELTPVARELARELGIPSNEPIGSLVLEAGQAAEVVLDAIGRSDGTRASVLEQLKATNVEDGILGSFRFDRYGDMTPAEIPLLRITRSAKHSQRLGLEDAVVDRMVSVPASLSG